MFGYILPNLESLDEEEKVRYRSVYCGVCRSLKVRYGQMSRIGVSYDMAFLALLLGSLYEPEEASGQARCPVHPLAPQRYVRTPFTDYAADLSVALVYHKCLDDWRDDASKRARGVSLVLSGAYRTAARLRPEACAIVERAMADVHELEESRVPSPDAVANRFGLMLGDLFAIKDDFWATELRRFGARLGKFVYVMDAAMDLEEDRESGSYNPFAARDIDEHAMDENLELLAANMTESFERLPLERDVHVMRSVLYAGVWQQYKQKKEGGKAHG